MPTFEKEIDAVVMAAIGFMSQANAEIRAAQQRHHLERAERWQRGRPIAFIDELINDLETLKLKRVSHVPTSYESRLRQLRTLVTDTTVPSDQLEKLRTWIGILKLMDELYAMQDVLFTGGEGNVSTSALARLDRRGAWSHPLQRAGPFR